MRTDEEINNAIIVLKEKKNEMPEFSAFGDNNYEAYDLAIEVLEKKITNDEIIFSMNLNSYVEGMGCVTVEWLNGVVELDEII